MKKFKTIFIFIFLASMVFTVFQYIPLSDDESGSLVELAKKAKENDCSGNDASDDDSGDSDSGDDFFIPQHFYWCQVIGDDLSFIDSHALCPNGVKRISTPPPKA